MTELLSGPLKGFDRYVHRMLKEWNVPGTAVGIVKGNRVIHAKGYGLRDVKRGLPVTENTLFGIGSCTKSFTATAIGILVDEGRLEWDKPVREYIPFFKLRDPIATQRVTVRDLLTHRTGLLRHDIVAMFSSLTRKEVVRRLRYLEPTVDFRSKFQYNNLMYIALGYLIEQVSGKTWEDFVRERILVPLDMKDTLYMTDEGAEEKIAVDYLEKGAKLACWRSTYVEKIDHAAAYGPTGPAGTIVSNVKDLCRWLRLQMNNGSLGKRTIISSENLSGIHTPQMVVPDFWFDGKELLDISYGMGWFAQSYRGYKHIYHGGTFTGFKAHLSFLPRAKIGVVVLTNTSTSPLRKILTFEVYDRLMGFDKVNWNSREKQRIEEEKLKAKKKKKTLRRKPGTKPSLPLKVCVGEYFHPGYGKVRISMTKEQLNLKYKIFTYKMEHYQDDVFQVTLLRRGIRRNSGKMKVSFHVDKKGTVKSIAIPFEEAVGDIVFKRRKDR